MSVQSNEDLLKAFGEAIRSCMLDEGVSYGRKILELMTSQEPAWETMETAPQHDSVLLWYRLSRQLPFHQGVGWWSAYTKKWQVGTDIPIDVTRWRPLPEAPK